MAKVALGCFESALRLRISGVMEHKGKPIGI
jgi:hypothetical protein